MKIELPVVVNDLIDTLSRHFNLDPAVVVRHHFVTTMYGPLCDFLDWANENAPEKRSANWLAGRAIFAGTMPISLKEFPKRLTPGWQSPFDKQVELAARHIGLSNPEEVRLLSERLNAWRTTSVLASGGKPADSGEAGSDVSQNK